ncbi:MAG: serine/threonine protein kinase [Planctomycetes bacterium]|nr:serine/threonine protein kinase [Planctomycetota bacterium]
MRNNSDSDRLADLVARCILHLEAGERDAADALLAKTPEFAAVAREQLQALRDCGLLQEGSRGRVPERIGPYRILELIGYGGMGAVYLAEQLEPVERRVAVKVIRPGMDTREVLARFAVERQTLAILDHPNIARIYDAGSTDEGHPYLVMEYVDGEPLDRYCDRVRLNIAARERLLAGVCDTVQHAHEAGILHRDLKPSNILVVEENGVPQPKIIDFGVAKSTQQRHELATLLTQHGHMLGTPEYMSPEQAVQRVDIDTRTDVYSLGAVLYELVSGCLPIDSARLRRSSLAEIERLLASESVGSASGRFAALEPAAAAGIAAARGTEPRALQRQLRGELDWICRKALEKDRERRYRMPIELAADLRRHLDREPVLAGPPSAWYRFRCFAARNRLQVTAAALVLLSVVVGLGVSLHLLAQVRDEAERARINAKWAFEAVDELLTKVAEGPLVRAPGAQPLRRDLLLSALRFNQRFTAFYRDDPGRAYELVSAFRRLAQVQSQLGDHDGAMASNREALRLLDRLVAAEPDRDDLIVDRAGVRSTMACDMMRQGDDAAAREALGRAETEIRPLAVVAGTGVATLRTYANVLNNMAALRAGSDDSAGAITGFEQAVAIAERIVASGGGTDADRRTLATRLAGLAVACLRIGDKDAAERHLARGQPVLEELVAAAPGDRERRDGLANLVSIRGTVADARGERETAVAHWTAAAAIYRRLVEEFPSIPEYRHRLAGALINTGMKCSAARRSDEALALFGEAERALRRALATAPTNASVQERLLKVLDCEGRELIRLGRDETAFGIVDALLGLDVAAERAGKLGARLLERHLTALAQRSAGDIELAGARRRFDALVAAGALERRVLAEEPWRRLGSW